MKYIVYKEWSTHVISNTQRIIEDYWKLYIKINKLMIQSEQYSNVLINIFES